MKAQIWPDEEEKQSLIAAGWGGLLDMQFMSKDLARGGNIIFTAAASAATLCSRGGSRGSIAATHSVLMRARSGTVRFIGAASNARPSPAFPLRPKAGFNRRHSQEPHPVFEPHFACCLAAHALNEARAQGQCRIREQGRHHPFQRGCPGHGEPGARCLSGSVT